MSQGKAKTKKKKKKEIQLHQAGNSFNGSNL